MLYCNVIQVTYERGAKVKPKAHCSTCKSGSKLWIKCHGIAERMGVLADLVVMAVQGLVVAVMQQAYILTARDRENKTEYIYEQKEATNH